MLRRHQAVCLLLLSITAACSQSPAPTPAPGQSSLLITNATVIDGTGSPGRRVFVRVQGDRIAAVGDIQRQPGDSVVDAAGLVLAPGFIDTHSHADDGLFNRPDALAVVSQGITTIIGGQDGGSPLPLAAYFAQLEKQPAAVNLGLYVGHGSVRDSVMGADFKRVATPAEVARMSAMVSRRLE